MTIETAILTNSSSISSVSTSYLYMIAKHFRSLLSLSLTMNSVVYCLIYFVIFENFVISVDAIRCYQCNSHNNKSCLGLLPNENSFLDECPPVNDEGLKPFCRKIALTIEYKEDHRIIRSCGYTPHINRSERCLTADNEGYLEQVCQCFTDGCNAATSNLRKFNLYENSIIILSILLIGLVTRINHLNYV